MSLRALEIDDSLPEAHAALGSYLADFEWDWKSAEREYLRAIELDPNYATAHHWLGNHVLSPTRRFDEALVELRRAELLDPLSLIIGTNLGDALVYTRRFDEAISQYNKVLALEPNFAFGRFALGWAYYSKGMYQESIAELRKSLELSESPTTKGYLAMSLAKAGQREEALKLLAQLKQESSQRYVMNTDIAAVYIGLDQKDEALHWLEKDVAEHSSFVTFMSVDPIYDDLRNEPRFKAMLKRLNLPGS
jgi:tetratricopeptide (TPR) repeat protein